MNALLRELDRLRTAGDPASARAEIVRMFEAVRAEAYEDAARVCDRYDNGKHSNAADLCADAIRARAKEVSE